MCPLRVWVTLSESHRRVCVGQSSVVITGLPPEGRAMRPTARSGVSESTVELTRGGPTVELVRGVQVGDGGSGYRTLLSESSRFESSSSSSHRYMADHPVRTEFVVGHPPAISGSSRRVEDGPDATDFARRPGASYDDIPELVSDDLSSHLSIGDTDSWVDAHVAAGIDADPVVHVEPDSEALSVGQLDAMLQEIMRQLEEMNRTTEITDMSLGADPYIMERLPTCMIRSVEDLASHLRTCEVCLEEYFAGDKRMILPCLHGFHEACI
uniref:RING-type domain-containing protein n=1 Tax=Odontella aurita TaxID=265563 RepID=A0A7S4JTM0_9STRA|mmetsp:Transcript_53937/g.161431  ORF Transcript_53937/g.161431 Transcript_53937/m.161431 type:complete len:268 (+) Transcript_53937:662-1465(+)